MDVHEKIKELGENYRQASYLRDQIAFCSLLLVGCILPYFLNVELTALFGLYIVFVSIILGTASTKIVFWLYEMYKLKQRRKIIKKELGVEGKRNEKV